MRKMKFREPELERLYQKMMREGAFDKLKETYKRRNGSD